MLEGLITESTVGIDLEGFDADGFDVVLLPFVAVPKYSIQDTKARGRRLCIPAAFSNLGHMGDLPTS